MSHDRLALLRQSLEAAQSAINAARQLLAEIETAGSTYAEDLPGEIGVFDGINVVTAKGERFPVPANYASKSLLLVGDTLKILDVGGEKRFRQIGHVERLKTTGILDKRDGQFTVTTPEGSYKVLEASIDHFRGGVGDLVVLYLPANNLTAPYGAVEAIHRNEGRLPGPMS